MVNKTIVKASQDTSACYGVKKCAEIVFNRGRMTGSLNVLAEKMKAQSRMKIITDHEISSVTKLFLPFVSVGTIHSSWLRFMYSIDAGGIQQVNIPRLLCTSPLSIS